VLASLLVLFIALGWLAHQGVQRCLAASRADWGRPWLHVLDGFNRIFCRRFHRLRAAHLPLPMYGPVLVVANHVSGLDPLLMIASAHRPLRFLIAREEYERFGFRWLFRAVGCIPVDRGGSPHRALVAARKALQKGEAVALFPHGRIYLDHEGPARLKPGIRHLAELSGAPVYPLRIDGVRGAGRTLAAVFLRSRARIAVFPPLVFDRQHPEQLLQELAQRLHPPLQRKERM